jgi:hypothetical protein
MDPERDKRLLLAFMANPNPPPKEPTMTQARAIPMHPDLPHLTHLGYFLIAGGQPRGRTVLVQQPKPSPTVENAAAVIQAIIDGRKQKAMAANA